MPSGSLNCAVSPVAVDPAVLAGAGDGDDRDRRAARIDAADEVVLGIGDDEEAGFVDDDAGRTIDHFRIAVSAAVGIIVITGARERHERRHLAAGDFPDGVVLRVRDPEVVAVGDDRARRVERGREQRAVRQARAAAPGAGERRDDAVDGDAADLVVLRVGDVDRAVGADRESARIVELRRAAGAVAAPLLAVAGDRFDFAVEADLAESVVAAVGDVENVALRVEGDAAGVLELRGGAGAVVEALLARAREYGHGARGCDDFDLVMLFVGDGDPAVRQHDRRALRVLERIVLRARSAGDRAHFVRRYVGNRERFLGDDVRAAGDAHVAGDGVGRDDDFDEAIVARDDGRGRGIRERDADGAVAESAPVDEDACAGRCARRDQLAHGRRVLRREDWREQQQHEQERRRPRRLIRRRPAASAPRRRRSSRRDAGAPRFRGANDLLSGHV